VGAVDRRARRCAEGQGDRIATYHASVKVLLSNCNAVPGGRSRQTERMTLLSDLVVVDLTRALAGPHAAMMLGDLGARVIKVEHPDGGDDSRGWGPPFVGSGQDRLSTYFLSCNRNKESVTADLKSAEGVELVRRLVRQSDILCENFRPGVLDRLGLSVPALHALNPRLIVLSITGFGHDGPEGGRAGYDQIAQGEAGVMSVTGPPGEPTKVGLPIGDLLAGMYGVTGVLAALHEREATGRGQVVRTSLLAALVGVHAYSGTQWTVAGEVPEAVGNQHPSIAPYGLFHASDAPIQIACGSEGLWRAFAPLVGLSPDDGRFATNVDRVRHRGELTRLIDEALSTAPAHSWVHTLSDAGIPVGLVRTVDEVYSWPQTRSQGLVVTVDAPGIGPVALPGPPLRFADAAHAGGRTRHSPPPRLGEHTERVLTWLAEREAGSGTGRKGVRPPDRG
jgi:crotonobetainyl-CoA:carnitine CoA-transferase CaiB-like acyl-CoA transferase